MKAKRSIKHSRSRCIPGMRFTAACLGVALSLLFAHGSVFASGIRPAQRITPPSAHPEGTGIVQQEPIVEVEVDVRGEEDIAILKRMGYSCSLGACKLELRQGEELALSQAGLTVNVTARAIKLSGGIESLDAAAAPLGEHSMHGENWDDVYVDDWNIVFQECGWETSSINISGAPFDATVSRIKYTARIDHENVGDLVVSLGRFPYLVIWNRLGHNDDEGLDDDPETDADIELIDRETDYFNGKWVNGTWSLWVDDCAWWNTGYIDYWNIYVYYWICETSDFPAPPAWPDPANSATGVSRNANLDWRDSSQATSYDVFFGVTSPPPYKGHTHTSDLALDELGCSTHYYWKVVAKNQCANVNGPEWEFTTACCPPDAPSWVSPPDNAANMSINADLYWSEVPGASSYDVFFGQIDPPRLQGNTTSNSFSLAPLSYVTHYYWKIEAINACGITSGPVWDFTTQAGDTNQYIYLPLIIQQ
jgi:subtilisin-like proprotein convertase family protein